MAKIYRDVLGEGGYATVKKGLLFYSKDVAVKILKESGI